MSLESALASEITELPGVAGLIGDRVYPVAAPQTSASPFITYRRVTGEVQYTHEGESRIQRARFQLSAIADTYETVIELAEAIRSGLSGKRSLGNGIIQLNGIFFMDPEDTWNRETGLFVRSQDCTITYRKGE
ncbi:DUF3168 domain-containing protein [Chloroflexi bacterium CFX6]|nr:DUF3168 domain-containing protein [Chloroflexi bacterium CFX6]